MSSQPKKCDTAQVKGSSGAEAVQSQKTRTPAASKPESTQLKQEIEILRQKISQLVSLSPEKAATILAEWMRKK